MTLLPSDLRLYGLTDTIFLPFWVLTMITIPFWTLEPYSCQMAYVAEIGEYGKTEGTVALKEIIRKIDGGKI